MFFVRESRIPDNDEVHKQDGRTELTSVSSNYHLHSSTAVQQQQQQKHRTGSNYKPSSLLLLLNPNFGYRTDSSDAQNTTP
jgi:hypothetical protein